jgi:hypothetical protein
MLPDVGRSGRYRAAARAVTVTDTRRQGCLWSLGRGEARHLPSIRSTLGAFRCGHGFSERSIACLPTEATFHPYHR